MAARTVVSHRPGIERVACGEGLYAFLPQGQGRSMWEPGQVSPVTYLRQVQIEIMDFLI